MNLFRWMAVLSAGVVLVLALRLSAAAPPSPRPPAVAEGRQPGDIDGDDDHERARDAFERGEIVPLQKVLAVVGARIEGEIAEIEFEREDGVWAYEVKIITPNGRMIEVYVDAGTGEIMKIEGE